ncbi:MAG: acyl-CoA dehydrogenase family protein [Deltaproteobacteria bacterium]|nr:acyl-CoA dehydrogenase family protein [Deltaproteobacteria bacterium]
MAQGIYTDAHQSIRRNLRQFIEREVNPRRRELEDAGQTPRDLWKRMGELGFLGPCYPEEYGGSGADFLTACVITEELSRCAVSGFAMGFMVHAEMATPPIHFMGTDAQRRKWLAPAITGEMVFSLGISEPNAGSDVAAIRTTARRDGDHYVVSGSKCFITNGTICDGVVLAVKTDPAAAPPHAGVSLLVVEKGAPGFKVGRKLEKIGCLASDTSELFFEDCRVPVANRLGGEGEGFVAIMRNFQRERLIAAVGFVAGAEEALEMAIKYARERDAFGKPIHKHQSVRHLLVEMATETELVKTFVQDQCVKFSGSVNDAVAGGEGGEDLTKTISMAKYRAAELTEWITDRALQIHGGWGYMKEFPISQAFLDARAGSIAGGTTEIMKEIIGKYMGL